MKQLTKHLALSAGLLVALASCSPKLSKQKSAALTTRQDSVAYAFGVLNGQAFSEVLSRMPGDTLSRQQILAAFGDVTYTSEEVIQIDLIEARGAEVLADAQPEGIAYFIHCT